MSVYGQIGRPAVMVIICTGATFGQFGAEISDPVPVNTFAAQEDAHDEYPRVATEGTRIRIAVWESQHDLGGTLGTDWDILVARSTDRGATWSDAAPLNGNAATDAGSDRSPSLAADQAGRWIVVWSSTDTLGGTIGADRDILFALSTDSGMTWSDPAPLNTNADLDNAADGAPEIATDGNGQWVVVWRSYTGTGSDIVFRVLVARSVDNGLTWGDPLSLTGSGSDVFLSHPAINTDGNGRWMVVWSSSDELGGTIGSDPDILMVRSVNNGLTWSDPAPLNQNAPADTGADLYPDVAADGAGHWLVVWMSFDDLGGTIGTDADLLVTRSTDNGATWSDPAPLNNHAATDDGYLEEAPDLVSDGAGNWVVVWRSTEQLEGSFGADDDILLVHSTDLGVTWTDPTALHFNGYGDQNPSLAADGAGNWVAVWQSYAPIGGESLENIDPDIIAVRFQLAGTGPPIPAVSEWGLLLLGLSVAAAGTLVLRRKRAAQPKDLTYVSR